MKKIMMGVATCALILTGCSLNEMMDSPDTGKSDGTIKFGVNTPVTRAENLWSNDNFATTARKFNVVGATTGGVEYLGTFGTPREVSYDGVEWSYENKLYWPTETLNFFSWFIKDNAAGELNEDLKPSKETNNIAMKFTSYKVNSTIASQEDFLVAAGGYTKEETSNIYFKHALTKILFKAEVFTGSQLKVTIDDVALYNVDNRGDLTATVTSDVKNPGLVWDNQATEGKANKKANYTMGAFGSGKEKTIVTGGTSSSYLHNGDDGTKELSTAAMLLMPQTFDPWQPLAATEENTIEIKADGSINASKTKGAFIAIKCKIEALQSNNTPFTSPMYLHGGASATKWLFIPISSVKNLYGEWLANRAITYVITFGDKGSGSGGGGWTGDDGDHNGEIDPVLVPINFRVDVSDWDKFDVILQSVNFNKVVDSETAKQEVDNIMSQLLTEATANPQKCYDANINLTFGTVGTSVDLSTSLNTTFAKFDNNNKFLGMSKITVKVTASDWSGKSFKLPAITGWTAATTELTTNGSITYTKDGIAAIEAQRLNAMKDRSVMTVRGNSTVNWDYSTGATKIDFTKLGTVGEYLVLNFTDIKDTNTVTIKVGTDFQIVAVTGLDKVAAADFTNANQSASATATDKVLVIKKVGPAVP